MPHQLRPPEGDPRKEAARQLLESYYKQILVDGFFHADPHPGNLMWWNDEVIYFLDFGMVGEVGPEMREHLMLLLMAFWQEDVAFLTDISLMLSGAIDRSDLDVDAFQARIGDLMAEYRTASLNDIQLGPILQEMTEISLRHGVAAPRVAHTHGQGARADAARDGAARPRPGPVRRRRASS